MTYTDSEAATTTFSVLHALPGVRAGNRCVKRPGSRSGKRGRACTRYVAAGSFTRQDLAGRNRFHFTGRLRRSKLPPGNYRLSATPRAHATTGKTVAASFRIIR